LGACCDQTCGTCTVITKNRCDLTNGVWNRCEDCFSTNCNDKLQCPAGFKTNPCEKLGACCFYLPDDDPFTDPPKCLQTSENECFDTIGGYSWTECAICNAINPFTGAQHVCPNIFNPLVGPNFRDDIVVETIGNLAPTSSSLTSPPNNTEPGSNTNSTTYFNYDIRKTFNVRGVSAAYPEGISGGLTETQVRLCAPLINPNFRYYKQYSKTSATFWNTPKLTPIRRRAQMALMTAQRVKILVNGDFGVNPGKIVTVNSPNFGGRWMVYKVQRIFTPQKHTMYLYLMRDGVA
jgi:hypothetical protein